MSLAVFLNPSTSLKNEINLWKKKVKTHGIESKYINHPPHSTVINVEVCDYLAAITDLKKSVKNFKRFEITVDHKSVFWHDELAGGHTLYFGIKKNSDLFSFQKLIAESLKIHKINSIAPDFIIQNKLLYDSFKNYGFPFIGSHWVPHFTVASLKTLKEDKLIKKFLADVKLEKFLIDCISIWIVNNEQHNEIEKINLL